jgi:hypothetical protein
MKKIHTAPKKIPQLPSNLVETAPAFKVPKRDNIFSQSKDIREDRSVRQMKDSHNPITSPDAKGWKKG